MNATTSKGVTIQVQVLPDLDDAFKEIIDHGFPPDMFDDDDNGGHDENCWFYVGECDEIAKFWIASSDDSNPTGRRKVYLCPKHFALRLHNIIDTVTRSSWFDEQHTPSQRRAAFQTYFLEWGRIGL